MRDIFSLDSPIMSFLNKLSDLIILNLLFLVCSLPIITIGASMTAMCYVTLRIRDDEGEGIVKDFFKAFRQNFVQATIIWIILMLLAGVLLVDYHFVGVLDGTAQQIIRVLLPICAVILGVVSLYIFFIQARFQNTILNTFRNTLTLAVINAPGCLAAVVSVAAIWKLITFDANTLSFGLLVFPVIGFSGLAKLNCFLLCRKISGLAPKNKTAE